MYAVAQAAHHPPAAPGGQPQHPQRQPRIGLSWAIQATVIM